MDDNVEIKKRIYEFLTIFKNKIFIIYFACVPKK